MTRAEYQRYLQLPAWRMTRDRRLALAGYRCEFRPDFGPRDGLGERCAEASRLEVHHLHYGSLGAEQHCDLEVLCRFHHLVRHVEKACCERCGESAVNNVTDDDAIEIVQARVDDYGGVVDHVTVEDLDIPEYCDYCDHVLTKDD